ncbi:hypothetical protein ISCGN_026435 [Ixodes scapularis]
MRRPKTSFGLELWGPLFIDNSVGVPQKAAPTTSPLNASSTPSPARELHYMCSQYKGVALQALTTSMSSLLCCRGKFKGLPVQDYMCSQYKGVALQALTTSMSSLLCCRGKFKGLPVQGLPWI